MTTGQFPLHWETFKNRTQFLTAQFKGQSTCCSGIVLQAIPRNVMDKQSKTINRKGKGIKTRDTNTNKPLRDNCEGFVDSENEHNTIRIGFTATKKVGNAVARNKAKRRLRALADAVLLPNCDPKFDYVMIARESTTSRPWQKLENDVKKALSQLKVYKPHSGKKN